MKASLLRGLLLSLFSISALAADSSPHTLFKRAEQDVAANEEPSSTTFNGIEVPPQKELDPENFKSTISDGYWYTLYRLVT
jgi:protein disulfide-isomerase